MTRKDYKVLAEVFKREYDRQQRDGFELVERAVLEELEAGVADALYDDNPPV